MPRPESLCRPSARIVRSKVSAKGLRKGTPPRHRAVGHSFAVDFVELQPLLDFVDVEVELPEPDEERVEFLRQRWLREDA